MIKTLITASQIKRTLKTLSNINAYATDAAIPTAYQNNLKEIVVIFNALAREEDNKMSLILLDKAIDKINAFGCLLAHRNITGANTKLTEQRKHELEAVANMLEAVRVYLMSLITR